MTDEITNSLLEMVCRKCKDVTEHLFISESEPHSSNYDPFKILDKQKQIMCTQCGKTSYRSLRHLAYYVKNQNNLNEQT